MFRGLRLLFKVIDFTLRVPLKEIGFPVKRGVSPNEGTPI